MLLTVLPIVIALLALAATSWQAWIARDVEKRQLRAYVGVHQDGYTNLENDDPIGFRFFLRNHGQTPATEVNFNGIIDLLPFPLPADYELPKFPERSRQDGVLFAGEPNPMTAWVWERTKITHEEKKELLSSNTKKQIYLHGMLSYKDAFGFYHLTNFCYFLNHKSIFRDRSGTIVRDENGQFNFTVSPCEGRNKLQ